jgi:hypothetical protein
VTVDPAGIQRWGDAHDHGELGAVLEGQAEGGPAPAREAGQDVRPALGADRVMAQDEAPDVLEQVVLVVAGATVEPEGVGPVQGGPAGDGAVGHGDEHGGQLAGGDGGVERLQPSLTD